MDARLKIALTAAAETVIAHADELTALDQAIGDGDHGLNMKRGFEVVLAELPKLEGKAPGEVCKAVGMQLVMKVGGASGPLYGTFFIDFGKALPAAPTKADAVVAFQRAVEGVKARGKSEAGQKTMLDVLMPVQEALTRGGDGPHVKSIAAAAAEATIPMLATRGRASFLGERSVGHMDPGARSAALMIAAVADALKEGAA